MSNKTNKPKLTSEQLVLKMANEKGISFKYVSEKEAAEYFRNTNNYMRTASYRKNYQKHLKGKNKGKYIDLDFFHLQELSTIDMHLRNLITRMCIDIEHAMKVGVLRDIEATVSEDGYDIVEDFLAENGYSIKQLELKSQSPFTGELIKKYFVVEKKYNNITGRRENKIVKFDCPIWVFIELISFGEFIRFYKFCYNRISKSCININVINIVKSLRNGCAHNNCLLADLSYKKSRPPREISSLIVQIETIHRNQRVKRLSCRPILEFTCMLYLFNMVVSEKVKYHKMKELKEFVNGRMMEKHLLFAKNELIKSSFSFIKNVVDYMERI